MASLLLIDGCETCRRLKADPGTAPIPILIVLACDDEETMVEAFDAGVHDYVTKPFTRTVVAARVRAAARFSDANRELLRLAREDPLLGIGNRRAMEISLDHIHELSVRYHRPYSLLLFDVDYFKSFNDTYGHPAGDADRALYSAKEAGRNRVECAPARAVRLEEDYAGMRRAPRPKREPS